MIISLRNSILLIVLILTKDVFSQFEKISVRNTSIEFDKDLWDDTSATYLKLMLCGDLIHKSQLLDRYAKTSKGGFSYRSWFRQVKPLFYYPDFVVGSLRSFFPNREYMSTFPNSAPDEFLVEMEYTGFNVLMMSNADVLTDRQHINRMTLKKLDHIDIFRAGYYVDSLEKKENYPLILEKNDIRIAFLNYSQDSVLLDLPHDQINFFHIDSIRRDVLKARDTMLADYVITYVDWAGDTSKLGKVAELLNMGIDVIIGTGSGEAFTSADLLTYSDGSLRLHVDNIGYFNAETNERDKDKTAAIEIVLRKDKKSKHVSTHDMGFIPLWTLIDRERYAVLPISNIEEKHIKNINLNLIQYSTMKVALTDLRYAFFNKIPELHYDFTDRIVSTVEYTGFIRKTLMREQDKINSIIKEKATDDYVNLFGSNPPEYGSLRIPYEDIFGMYSNKTYASTIVPELSSEDTSIPISSLEAKQSRLEAQKGIIEASELATFQQKLLSFQKVDSLLQEEFRAGNHAGKGFENAEINSIYNDLLTDVRANNMNDLNLKLNILRNSVSKMDYDAELSILSIVNKCKTGNLRSEDLETQKPLTDSLIHSFIKRLKHLQYKDPSLMEESFGKLKDLLASGDCDKFSSEMSELRSQSLVVTMESRDRELRSQLDAQLDDFAKKSEANNNVKSELRAKDEEIDAIETTINRRKSYVRRKKHNETASEILKSRKRRNRFLNQRDTSEIYGQIDEMSPRGILNIKANHKKYQRERVRVLTAREKFVLDSIKRYNDRFIVIDTIAELRKELKRRRRDSIKRRDSIFYASLNPNYKSTYAPKVELANTSVVSNPRDTRGVFTQPEETREGNVRVSNIDEYFMVQIYTLASKKPLDIIKYPYLMGYEIRYEEGYYRYYLGRTNSKKLAIELLKSIRTKGHVDAMLVRYTDGVRRQVKTTF